MENSVINALISRIDYYAKTANITSSVEVKQYKKDIKKLENDELFNALEASRILKMLNLRMGKKRTTEKMYLEKDIEDVNELLNSHLKNNGRNFVETMKPKEMVKTLTHFSNSPAIQ